MILKSPGYFTFGMLWILATITDLGVLCDHGQIHLETFPRERDYSQIECDWRDELNGGETKPLVNGKIERWDWEVDEFNEPFNVVNTGHILEFKLELQYYHGQERLNWWQAFEACNDLGRPFNNETKKYLEVWEPLYEMAIVDDLVTEDCIFLEDKKNPRMDLRRPNGPVWLSGIRDPVTPNKMHWVRPQERQIRGQTRQRNYEFNKHKFNRRMYKLEDTTDITWKNLQIVRPIEDPNSDSNYVNWFLDKAFSYNAGYDTVYDNLTSMNYPIDIINLGGEVENHHRNCLVVTNTVHKGQTFRWLSADCYSKFNYVCKPRVEAIRKYLTDYWSTTDRGVFQHEPHWNNKDDPNMGEYSKEVMKHWACEILRLGNSQAKMKYYEYDDKMIKQEPIKDTGPEYRRFDKSDLAHMDIKCPKIYPG